MNLFIAPIQGHTDAPYRHFHAETYGQEPVYFTPFIRLERGELRIRDIKDAVSELNNTIDLVPQIIFRNEEELKTLVMKMKNHGAKSINLNMGCPFPLQTGHGRGAATIANTTLVEEAVRIVNENPDIQFSVKMRLGMSDPDEWKIILPSLNEMTLNHIAVHPRVARQQYGGELYHDRFAEFLSKSKNPVVWNGEIKTPEQMTAIIVGYPGIAGVMVGRGVLARPSLFREFIDGIEWPLEKRLENMLTFHRALLNHYSSTLCGESQLLSKIKPFWEYAEEEIGRKAWKAIKKASNIAKYHSAVAMIHA